MRRETKPGTKLSVDAEALETNKRLATYEIVNAHLAMCTDMQRVFDLRPDACQIYMLIAITAVQRYARNPVMPEYLGTRPLPANMSAAISRRQLSECTGIPRETVARHVRHLIARGLVVETQRGQLRTPPGLLRQMDRTGLPGRMAQETARMANALLRIGVIRG